MTIELDVSERQCRGWDNPVAPDARATCTPAVVRHVVHVFDRDGARSTVHGPPR
ncbi:MAG: hypothetical protein IT379_26275 [Deltaproteobacteria bacterium]|nr:hypothetical protein [Deltaproteobacteria bacterium]